MFFFIFPSSLFTIFFSSAIGGNDIDIVNVSGKDNIYERTNENVFLSL